MKVYNLNEVDLHWITMASYKELLMEMRGLHRDHYDLFNNISGVYYKFIMGVRLREGGVHLHSRTSKDIGWEKQ